MCGIFGALHKPTTAQGTAMDDMVRSLFAFSESRGKEASGLVAVDATTLVVYKEPTAASELVRTHTYRTLAKRFGIDAEKGIHAVVGHARLVTNGTLAHGDNNQPVIKDGIVGVHNGIIVNDAELWQKFPTLTRTSEVDTEVMLALVRHFLADGRSLVSAFQETSKLIEGSLATALVCAEQNSILLATNNGSLYRMYSEDRTWHFFGSEAYILERLRGAYVDILGHACRIERVLPRTGYVLNLGTLEYQDFSFESTTENRKEESRAQPLRHIISVPSEKHGTNVAVQANINDYQKYAQHYETNKKSIDALVRCSRCILPSTMPFIEFDADGVCNYCHHYRKQSLKGREALEQRVSQYRKEDGSVDCIMGLSGGRDSSYGLHYIVKELGMNPVSFSYDWGMITDEGRRNQARMSGGLGVEHILVSADIQKKRGYIRKNVTAWLKNPDLGMIPLFMAGDKQYFYHAHRLKKQVRANAIILCASPYEKTDFKTGFCGIKPVFNFEKAHYELTLLGKIQLAWYYLKQFVINPRYFNLSLLDTIGAYVSYYFLPHNYVLLFDYIAWDEKVIDDTLMGLYKWQTASDTAHTWRIVDGTASFYNYIYYTAAGFTENDTFRSNQIREGVLTREEALRLSARDNAPRFPSIQWYCDTIGIDFKSTMEVICKISTRYDA